MKYNKTTMLLTDLSKEDKKDILDICSNLVLYGKYDFENKIIQFWLNNACENDNHKLLMIATAMPQRLLLSIIIDK